MPYFEDMSEYTYFKAQRHCVNIGWLDRANQFKQGRTSIEFKGRLFEFCRYPTNQTRGFHICNFCQDFTQEMLHEQREGKTIIMGSAEILVKDKSGRLYSAPTLIYHYVNVHEYLPPIEFIEAVMACNPKWNHESKKGFLTRLFGFFSPSA